MLFLHYFWDFDGTLFDTYPRVTRAFVRALSDAGVRASFGEVYPLVKISLAAAAEYYAPTAGVSPQALLDGYHLHAEEEGYETMLPFPGAAGFLRAVAARGGGNYLYTHRGPSGIKALEHYGLTPLFADFVTSADGFAPKPAPDALNYLCDKHALPKASCVMLGDRVIDLDAGKNAGMACAAVDPDGLCPPYDTPYRVSSFAELSDIMIDRE